MLESKTFIDSGQTGTRHSYKILADADTANQRFMVSNFNGTRSINGTPVFSDVISERNVISTERFTQKPVAPVKIEAIDATVQAVEQAFVIVKTTLNGSAIDIQIPLELCPADLLYVGTPVSISVDNDAKYSTLKVTLRKDLKELSSELKARFAAVSDWIKSI